MKKFYNEAAEWINEQTEEQRQKAVRDSWRGKLLTPEERKGYGNMKTFTTYFEQIQLDKQPPQVVTYDEGVLDSISEMAHDMAETLYEILPDKAQDVFMKISQSLLSHKKPEAVSVDVIEEHVKKAAIAAIEKDPEFVKKLWPNKKLDSKAAIKKLKENVRSFALTNNEIRAIIAKQSNENTQHRKNIRSLAHKLVSGLVALVITAAGSGLMHVAAKDAAEREFQDSQRYEVSLTKVENLKEDIAKVKEKLKSTPPTITVTTTVKGVVNIRQQPNPKYVALSARLKKLTTYQKSLASDKKFTGAGASSRNY